ncbi:MAG TPA: gamma carbonic anhydrase family protein, partial [Opitutaceae bacterium]|nr:gamma carbonic anhydrase family protein [Opitutaceae bacterium]
IVHLADEYGVKVGRYTTIGHAAIIHACTIGNECLIGMGCTILDGAEIGDRCIVGANALVTKGFKAHPGSLILGSPAKVVRSLSDEEQAELRGWAEKYIDVAKAHAVRRT